MNSVENSTQVQTESSPLSAQLESLRQVLVSLLVLLLVVSGTLNLYFWRQYRSTSATLKSMRPQAPQMDGEIAQMQEIWRRMADYGRTHPDFAPILAKYGLRFTSATGAAPASVGAPGAALPPPTPVPGGSPTATKKK
ncbi:MAG: hypothetical protein DME25_14160 [Verrucomicrobia bacterium]|nr:MAG: hypothetical protein DME25_14160 [Verrucomicrobiota bacterium]